MERRNSPSRRENRFGKRNSPSGSPYGTVLPTGADGSDVLLVVMGVFLVAVVFSVGVLYWKLHSLPERMAHKSQKLQFEFVAVLGLISLFTGMHAFWIAGLLLALIDIPDFGTPLRGIAGSVERIADAKSEAAETASLSQPSEKTRSGA